MTYTDAERVDWRALWASGDLARFCFICLGILLHATNETMVATVMPAMVGDLSGVQLVGWSLAVYEIGAITAGAAAGRLVSYVSLRTNMMAAALLYAAGVFWTLGYDTIYAVQDLEDDALAGVKSSARRLGAAAPKAVLGFYVVSFVLVLTAAFVAGLGPLFWPPAAVYGMQLSRQAGRLRLDDPAQALALFNSNSLAGLLLFLAIVAGGWRGG